MSSAADNLNITKSQSSKVNVKEEYPTEPSNNYSISKSNIPSYTKILVPHDGKEYQIKHLFMQSIYQIFLEQKLSSCV